MKKIALSFIASLAVASGALAGHEVVATSKEYKAPAPIPCFRDTELQLDLFGTYNWLINRQAGGDDGFGGGVALNYFFMRHVGVGVDTNLFDGGVSGLWNFTGSLIIRFPIEAEVCLAPYIFGGGGYAVDGQGEGTVHAGGGLEWRIVPEKIGIFAEGRYTWSTGNEHGDAAQARLGVRFVF